MIWSEYENKQQLLVCLVSMDVLLADKLVACLFSLPFLFSFSFFRFVLAIVDSGACVSLMGVSIFYRRCPATSRFLAFYPATPSGAEPTSLVPVTGTCVPHSQSQGGTAPRMHCNTEGEWLVPVGGCMCDAGYEPNHNGSACLGESTKLT